MLDVSYFKEYYKIIAIDLSKQQALDSDPEETQQINKGNIDRAGNTTLFFIIEEVKETILNFHKELWDYQFISL